MLANQKGQEFTVNVAVVARKFEGHVTEKVKWISGDFRNIQNFGDKCLDVYGGANNHNQHVIFWPCHNGLNQAWIIDQQEAQWPKQPIDDGVKFQIRSKMAGGKALFYHEKTNEDQYIVRIQDHQPWDDKQWWFLDSRTRTIRPVTMKDFALSHMKNKGFIPDVSVVIRKFIGKTNQKTAYWIGDNRNIRDTSGFCLDVHGGHNHHHRHVIFWPCHNGLNQAWTIDEKGVEFPAYPLADNVKFTIRSKMAEGRAVTLAVQES